MFVIYIFVLSEKSVFGLWALVWKYGGYIIIYQKFCNSRGLVCCISYQLLYSKWFELVVYAFEGSAVVKISFNSFS